MTHQELTTLNKTEFKLNKSEFKNCQDCKHLYGVSLCKREQKPTIAAYRRLTDCKQEAKYFEQSEVKQKKSVLHFRSYLY